MGDCQVGQSVSWLKLINQVTWDESQFRVEPISVTEQPHSLLLQTWFKTLFSR